MPATGAMAAPAIPRRWMCAAFVLARVKCVVPRKIKLKAPARCQRYENQNQTRGTIPFATQGKPARYEPSQNRREHVGAAKINSNRPTPEFRACLHHPPIDAPERPMEA